MKVVKIKKILFSPISIVTIGFLISVVMKAILVADFDGPIILEDEFEYKQNAWHIFAGIPGFHVYYIPPLYPLLLSISFIFDNFYLVMKIENVILTSLSIFPCYLILKRYLTDSQASFGSLIILILPIHFSMNQLIMSENLFFPLFVFFLYLLLVTIESFSIKLSLYTGLVLGTLLLTRYFGTALAPAILLIYGVHLIKRKESLIRKQVWISLFILSLISAIIYIPWVLYSYSKIVKNVEDFFITSNASAYAISEESRIFIWLIRYLCYLVLMVSPVLSILLFGFIGLLRQKLSDRMQDLFVVTISVSICFICLAAYQVRLADVNYSYINGRYITYLNVPWLMTAGVLISRKKVQNGATDTAILLGSMGLSLLVIYFAYLVNIEGFPWKISSNYITSFNFMEGFLFERYSKYALFSVIFLNLVLVYVHKSGKKKLVYLILIYLLFCIIPHINSLGIFINQPYWASYQLFKRVGEKDLPVLIYYNTRYPIHHKIVENYFSFFNVKTSDYRMNQVKDVYKVKDRGYIVTDTKVRQILPKYTFDSMFVYDSPIPKDLNEVYSFAEGFNSSLVEGKIIEMETPWKANVDLLENRMIFAAPKSEIVYKVNLPEKSNLTLRLIAAYHPLARNWQVSDGTRMQIKVKDLNSAKMIIFDRLVMENDKISFEYSLEKFKGKMLEISFITTNDLNSNNSGDWSVWIDPIVVLSK